MQVFEQLGGLPLLVKWLMNEDGTKVRPYMHAVLTPAYRICLVYVKYHVRMLLEM